MLKFYDIDKSKYITRGFTLKKLFFEQSKNLTRLPSIIKKIILQKIKLK